MFNVARILLPTVLFLCAAPLWAAEDAGDPSAGAAATVGHDGHPSMAHQHAPSADFDSNAALKISQAVIGHTVGDYRFTDITGKTVKLSDYRGKPLVVSLVYTSCFHVCPSITRYLHKVVNIAQDALGPDSFSVITIGFDTANDTPQAMRNFARQQDVNKRQWQFLSADAATIEGLTKDLGFIYYASPKGFDHLAQATVIDPQGKVYRQVYGDSFDTPLLVEPLKELVTGVVTQHGGFAGLSRRIRLFCTVYDPATQSYRTDYSLFVGIAVGGFILTFAVVFLIREARGKPRQGSS
jgi:protein SCO1/2